jgi:putative RNA 2'-phosphotransferase
MVNYVDLSRVASHALRHEPWRYELELDDQGWVPAEELLTALRCEKPEWSGLAEADLSEMISRSEKKRHELSSGKIRALYGHSVPGKLLKQPAVPPSALYHGTSPETAELIRRDGLRPMNRQYVHLSIDQATAEQVGRRKSPSPVLLVVKSSDAQADGIAFYRGNDLVWLADFVPARYIE